MTRARGGLVSRLPALRGAAGNVLVVALVLALLVAGVVLLRSGGGTRTVRAELVRAVGLYEGSDVRILGVKVG